MNASHPTRRFYFFSALLPLHSRSQSSLSQTHLPDDPRTRRPATGSRTHLPPVPIFASRSPTKRRCPAGTARWPAHPIPVVLGSLKTLPTKAEDTRKARVEHSSRGLVPRCPDVHSPTYTPHRSPALPMRPVLSSDPALLTRYLNAKGRLWERIRAESAGGHTPDCDPIWKGRHTQSLPRTRPGGKRARCTSRTCCRISLQLEDTKQGGKQVEKHPLTHTEMKADDVGMKG